MVHFLSIVCLTTDPQSLPKRVLHRDRLNASSFNLQCPLISLRSSCSFLRLLLRFPVTSVPSNFRGSMSYLSLQFSYLLSTPRYNSHSHPLVTPVSMRFLTISSVICAVLQAVTDIAASVRLKR